MGAIDDCGAERRALPEQTFTLRDGTPARARPLVPTDAEALRRGLARLSPESRQSRFLAPVSTLTDAHVRRLVDVDGIDHVAFGVFAPAGAAEEEPVAVGRIMRYPDDPTTADLAITVVDDWQRRGIGTALAHLLAAHRPDGVTTIRTMISSSNAAALALAQRMGRVEIRSAGTGVNEVDIRPFDA